MRFVVLTHSQPERECAVATSPTTHWEPRPVPPENLARLRAILFGPAPYADADDAPDEVDHSGHPTCGLDAAMDRFERHLRWFEEDARAGAA